MSNCTTSEYMMAYEHIVRSMLGESIRNDQCNEFSDILEELNEINENSPSLTTSRLIIDILEHQSRYGISNSWNFHNILLSTHDLDPSDVEVLETLSYFYLREPENVDKASIHFMEAIYQCDLQGRQVDQTLIFGMSLCFKKSGNENGALSFLECFEKLIDDKSMSEIISILKTNKTF